MADPDIDGWSGLGPFPVLWSVAFFGVLITAVAVLCLAALVEDHLGASLSIASVAAVTCGVILMVFGSGASGWMGRVWTLFASAVLVFLTLALAVIPAVAVGWPHSLRTGSRGV